MISETITINNDCKCCGNEVNVMLNYGDFQRWQHGQYIQDAAPYLNENEREFLISQICGDCFDKMYEGNDE